MLSASEQSADAVPDYVRQLARDAFRLRVDERQFPASFVHHNGAQFADARDFDCEVLIIGSGAGGGVAAEILAASGVGRILIVEEGPLRTAADFRMQEAQAYPDLYQEAAARKTADQAISILQGRSVGGSTTVNWTSSFRTPAPTLAWWQDQFALSGYDTESLAPWFAWAEQRMAIAPWPVPANANNALLRDGATQLGWSHGVIARNVHGCANLGYCGMGCPLNAKQSTLVTTLPSALARGATLISRVRIERLHFDGARATLASGVAMDEYGQRRDVPVRIRARHFLLAGGAINTPALLLRSQAPDPFRRIGTRTFLHPTVISTARFATPVAAHEGAPQSVYSDQFVWADGAQGRCGFKLEVPPIHPLIASTILLQHGAPHAAFMADLPQVQAVIALMRDGFHPRSSGGSVRVDAHGDALLDYPLNDYLFDGMRRAYLHMAELQFAAGAERVLPLHRDAASLRNMAAARQAIAALRMAPLRTQIFSAHVMGGCAFGEDVRRTVCDSAGRVRGLDNVSVCDGSLLPSSLGVNPQLTLFALAARLASALAETLQRN